MATCPAGHESASTDYCDTCGIRITGLVAAARPPGPAAPPDGATPPGSAPPPAPPGAEPCPNCGTDRSGQFCEACGFDFSSGRAPSRPAPIHGAATISAPVIRRRGSRPQSSQPATSPPSSGPPASSPPVSSPPASSPAGPAAPSPTAPYPADRSAPDVATWSAIVRSDRAYYDAVVAAGGAGAAAIKFPGYCPERRFRLTGPQMRIGRISPSRGFEPEIDLTGPPTDPGVSRLHAVLIPEGDGSWAILDPGSENGTHVNEVEIAPDQRVRLRDGDRVYLGAWTVLTIHAT